MALGKDLSAILKKLKSSSGLSSGYEGMARIFSRMTAEGAAPSAGTRDAAQAVAAASIVTAAIMQLPPGISLQIMDFIRDSFSMTSSLFQSCLLPQWGTAAGTAATVPGYAEQKLKSLFSDAASRRPQDERKNSTAVSRMQTPLGLISAYWTSEKWKQAWGLTLGVFTLKTAESAALVGMGVSAADLIGQIHQYSVTDPAALPGVIAATGTLLACYAGKKISTEGGHYLQLTTGRLGAKWDSARFRQAMSEPGLLLALLNTEDPDVRNIVRNMDHLLADPLLMMKGSVIQIATAAWGMAATSLLAGRELWNNRQKVEFLHQWAHNFHTLIADHIGTDVADAFNLAPGDYGSVVLAAGAAALYLGPAAYLASKFGIALKGNQAALHEAWGENRRRLQESFTGVQKISASYGQERILEKQNEASEELTRLWTKQIHRVVGYNAFSDLQKHGARAVSYGVQIPAFLGGLPPSVAIANAEMLTRIMQGGETYIDLLPQWASLSADTAKIADVAKVIEAAWDLKKFHKKTGTSDFQYVTGDRDSGIKFEDVALMHGTNVFLTLQDITLKKGSRTRISGANGCGKSSLLKAMTGHWPHGRGHISIGEGQSIYFSYQEPDLSGLFNLRELLAYPRRTDDFRDEEIRDVLERVGLEELFAQNDTQDVLGGRDRHWDKTLSGGQKQKLVLARMILQKYDVLLLDEATSAMDRKAALLFHETLAREMPGCTILSILHGDPPVTKSGEEFFDNILSIENGRARLLPVEAPVQTFHTAPVSP